MFASLKQSVLTSLAHPAVQQHVVNAKVMAAQAYAVGAAHAATAARNAKPLALQARAVGAAHVVIAARHIERVASKYAK
jgi:hypothetical protein